MKVEVVETRNYHITVCQWLGIFKSSVLDDDSNNKNIPLPCARVIKSAEVATIFGDLDF